MLTLGRRGRVTAPLLPQLALCWLCEGLTASLSTQVWQHSSAPLAMATALPLSQDTSHARFFLFVMGRETNPDLLYEDNLSLLDKFQHEEGTLYIWVFFHV